MSSSQLTKLFEPSTVAVVGASANPEKTGHLVLKNLVEKYSGRIYPVNPRGGEILGLKVYRRVGEIPESVDLAVLAIPTSEVAPTLEECVKNGTRFAIVIAAGFKEAGEQGAKLEEKIVKIARKGGIRLIGPNTIGIINGHNNLIASGVPLRSWRSSGISIVCQSGIFAGALAAWIMTNNVMGVGKVVALGNKCDLDESDILEYLGQDENTRVIGLHLEGIVDGRRFLKIARKVVKKKPIVAVKAARTEYGTKAALSHTGSLAVDDKVVDAAFRQAGIIRAENIMEMLDYLKAFEYQPLPRGSRVGLITLSGALGVLACDACFNYGLRPAQLSEKSLKWVKEQIMPPEIDPTNPIDVWAALGAGPARAHAVAFEAALTDENADAVISILLPLRPTNHDLDQSIGAVLSEHQNNGKTILACLLGGEFLKPWFEKLESMGIPCYIGPDGAERAVKALSAMLRYRYIKESEELPVGDMSAVTS
ncbi:MAG: CoA-binding protein [Candidatus Caldarchaeum sp.]